VLLFTFIVFFSFLLILLPISCFFRQRVDWFSCSSTVFALHYYFVSLALCLSFLQSCPLFSSVCPELENGCRQRIQFHFTTPPPPHVSHGSSNVRFRVPPARNIGPRRVRFRVTRYLSHIQYCICPQLLAQPVIAHHNQFNSPVRRYTEHRNGD
jgi:hypothetical protein